MIRTVAKSLFRHLERVGLKNSTQIFVVRLQSVSPKMERAVVRCVPTESQMTISFSLSGSQKHMLRDQKEKLGKLLARIAHNAVKSQGKRGKKSKNEESVPSEPTVKLYYRDEPVAEDTVNSDAWQDGSVLYVGDIKYDVERNPPTFLNVSLPRSVMAGFPVCPKIDIEFGDVNQSTYQWYKESKRATESSQETSWEEAGSERVFMPSNSDVGLKIKLKCTPRSSNRFGVPVELETACTVEAGPGTCTFDSRHLYTKMVAPDSIVRTVSYNILADIYAQTELSKTVLYPYCPPYALELDYRQHLIKKELSGYNADIVCLQEVDKHVFLDDLVPALDAFGLAGVFKIKEKQHEGLATFFRTAKFNLLSQHDIIYGNALVSDSLHSTLLERISVYPNVKEKFLQRSAALQVSVLQSTKDANKKVCVANTHLYWHPKGGNIRLLQIAIAWQHIHHIITEIYPNVPVIFCGDLNSMPASGVVTFLTGGYIDADHEDWVSNEKEQCQMSLDHHVTLQSACGLPAYTNYVGAFNGCLDYIFIDSNAFEVDQVVPLPSHDEVTTHHALPSVSHPSDHIALVCDLKWKNVI
ncbi:2',5'-phosphodiesterase 12 [Protopterus annectens]|uniref:2',5'-phosphodiesterase 12 n=1 Tax=Protopterus annectens TaxID=7888 RepID=UPI001CFB7A48|nr:2',5'-phosphodiesterase 12 [Protopterus annectens]